MSKKDKFTVKEILAVPMTLVFVVAIACLPIAAFTANNSLGIIAFMTLFAWYCVAKVLIVLYERLEI